jgi:Spy/CpxP family protein refolding chaperone
MHGMNHRTPIPGRAMQAIRGAMVVAVLSAGMSALAAAQSNAEPGNMRQQGTAAANRVAAAQLGGFELTAEQKAQIEVITSKYAGASRAAMQDMATDREDGLKKLMALREKMLPEFRAVLTAAQREIFDRNMAEMKARLSPRP